MASTAEITIDAANRKDLQDISTAIQELSRQRDTILKTIMNCKGIKEGNWSPAPDFSRLIRQDGQN